MIYLLKTNGFLLLKYMFLKKLKLFAPPIHALQSVSEVLLLLLLRHVNIMNLRVYYEIIPNRTCTFPHLGFNLLPVL